MLHCCCHHVLMCSPSEWLTATARGNWIRVTIGTTVKLTVPGMVWSANRSWDLISSVVCISCELCHSSYLKMRKKGIHTYIKVFRIAHINSIESLCASVSKQVSFKRLFKSVKGQSRPECQCHVRHFPVHAPFSNLSLSGMSYVPVLYFQRSLKDVMC